MGSSFVYNSLALLTVDVDLDCVRLLRNIVIAVDGHNEAAGNVIIISPADFATAFGGVLPSRCLFKARSALILLHNVESARDMFTVSCLHDFRSSEQIHIHSPKFRSMIFRSMFSKSVFIKIRILMRIAPIPKKNTFPWRQKQRTNVGWYY